MDCLLDTYRSRPAVGFFFFLDDLIGVVKFDFNVSKQHHWIIINKNTLQPNNTEDD